jgi:hypothetical protein
MRTIKTTLKDGRKVVTKTDHQDTRYCRVYLLDANDQPQDNDGPWPTGIAKQKHDEMVAQHNPVDCPTCKGNKKVTATVTTFGSPKVDTFAIKCVSCDGHGTVTPKRAKQIIDMQNAWCTCTEPGDAIHSRHKGQDYYTCPKCRKLLQVG